MYEFSCRICLQTPGVIPIFGDERKPDISIEISSFANLQVREDDCLPKFICEQCFKKLEVAVSFRAKAKRSDVILKRWRKRIRQTPVKKHSTPLKKPCTRNTEQTSEPPPNIQNESSDLNIPLKKETSDLNIPIKNETRDLNISIKQEKQLEVVSYYSIPEPEKPNFDFVKVEAPTSSEIDQSYADNDQSQFAAENQVHNDNSIRDKIEIVIECESDIVVKEGNAEIEIKEHNFYCKYCNEGFELFNEYEEHRDTVDHKQNYIKSFLPKKRRDNRNRETLNPKDHKCVICGRFFTKLFFAKHMKSEHRIILKKC